MKRTLITISAAVLAAVPATVGLSGNASFAQGVPVRMPSPVMVAQDKGAPAKHAEPGDDKGGRAKHAEPGDDKGGRAKHAEPGDDKGGRGKHAEPGDDKGAHGGDDGSTHS
jgi:hypothetical protein